METFSFYRQRHASIFMLSIGMLAGVASCPDGLNEIEEETCLLQESLKTPSYAISRSESLRVDSGTRMESKDLHGKPYSQVESGKEESFFLELLSIIPSLITSPSSIPSHPFPSWEWEEVKFPAILICAITLFFAGILCSAGGIGGGGVYVTVLLVMGQLSPHDAVPLSKSIVFFGSLSSLVLNLSKTLNGKAIVDFNVCRLVVPSSLLGTLGGVLFNSMMPGWIIVSLLTFILAFMLFIVTQKFYEQYQEEQEKMRIPEHGTNPQEAGLEKESKAPSAPSSARSKDSVSSTSSSMERVMLRGEGVGASILLALTITCGVLRHHAVKCASDLNTSGSNEVMSFVHGYGTLSCERPITSFLFGSMANMVAPDSFCWFFLHWGTILVPMLVILCVVSSYSVCIVKSEGWSWNRVLSFCVMGVFTGCFAGLVGIGGGLVFSPFLLWMAVDPGVAVATSSSLVIFTSSSTTFQYLLNDRIVVSLTIVYGMVNLLASYLGTSGVHALQDKYHARKSYITGIVAIGVIASVILSVYKLATMGVGH